MAAPAALAALLRLRDGASVERLHEETPLSERPEPETPSPHEPGPVTASTHSNAVIARSVRRGTDQSTTPGVTEDMANSGMVRRIRSLAARGGKRLPASDVSLGPAAVSARIHTGVEADRLARDLSAEAFTVGRNVFFSDGRYRPDRETGRELIRHELGHVAQQRTTVSPIPESLPILDPDHPAERSVGRNRSASVNSPVIQRLFDNAPSIPYTPGTDRLDAARESKAPEDITAVPDFSPLSYAEKMEFIDVMNGAHSPGPTLMRLWGTFGGGVVEVAKSEFDRWERSWIQGAQLYDLPGIKAGPQHEFKQAVLAKARSHLTENRRIVDEELAKLSPSDLPAPQADRVAAKRAKEIQTLVQEMRRVETLESRLKSIVVGWETLPGETKWDPVVQVPVQFSPSRPPPMGLENFPGGSPPKGARPHGQVKKHWDIVQVVRNGIESASPTIYAAVHSGTTSLSALEGEPASAASAAANSLRLLQGRIDNAKAILGTGIDWADLKPIHAALLGGDSKWSQPFYRRAAKALIDETESKEFWEALALSSASAALFVVATLTTGGVAAVALGAGVGLGVAEAAASWEKYAQIRGMENATARGDLALVASGQADDALISAVIDTVFAFLDGIEAVGQVARIARATEAARAAKEAGEAAGRNLVDDGLKLLKNNQPLQPAQAEQLISSLGVAETMRRSGASVEALKGMVGKGSPAFKLIEAHETLVKQAAKEGISVEDAAKKVIGKLAEMAQGAEADEAILQLAAQMGPAKTIAAVGGWKALATKVSPKGSAAALFTGWRDRIYRDLQSFMQSSALRDPLDEGARVMDAPGSTGITSDLDISFLGPHAEANRQRALAFLEARAGTSGPGGLQSILNASLFTDPARMLLYMKLDDAELRAQIAKRAAAREGQLVWAKMLHDARGDDVLSKELRAAMQEAGIEEIPWKPLGQGGRQRLAAEVDQMHGQFKELLDQGKQAEAGGLAEKIAERQAIINVASGEAYATGGGVRRWVAMREAAAKAGEKAFAKTTLDAHKLGNLVDQLAVLAHARAELIAAVGPAGIPDALRSIGKYGDRMVVAASIAIGQGSAKGKQLAGIADDFLAYKRIIDRGYLHGAPADELVKQLDELQGRALAQADAVLGDSARIMSEVRRAMGQLPDVTVDLAKVRAADMAHVALAGVRNSLLPSFAMAKAAIKALPTEPSAEGVKEGEEKESERSKALGEVEKSLAE